MRVIGEDIQLVTQLESGLGYVKADTGQIEQILMNLVVNARDAMPQGGEVTIATANVNVREGEVAALSGGPGPHVMLSVSDTGCGMSPAAQARMFEPFFTTKEPGKGTGLGLAILYGIVKQNNGHIRVSSQLQKGTRIEILLSCTNEMEAAREVVPRQLQAGCGAETLLLVEDDLAVRDLVGEVLRSAGYNVLVACDGNEALQLYARHQESIGLTLTDLVMPGISGPGLIESLQRLDPGARILCMSGYATDVVARHGQLDPELPFIQKPFKPSELIGKVKEALRGGVGADQGAGEQTPVGPGSKST